MSDDISKIRKDALICYNGYGNKGNCSGSYDSNNKVCLYCLEYLRRKPNPNKREMQDINLKEILDKVDKDTPNNEIEIPQYRINEFKFPIDLVEFPLVNGRNPKEVIYKGKVYIIQYLTSVIGGGKYHYKTITPRPYTLMDFRTLLATFYFADYGKSRWIENKFTDWLNLLEISDTGYYRKSIIEGLDYLKHTTFYTPYLWDIEERIREAYKDEDEPPTSVFSPIDEYHYFKDIKRKYGLKVEVGKTYYERIKEDYFTYLNIKELLPLSSIAMKLFIFLKRHDKYTLFIYPFVFELLRLDVGIKTKNTTEARKTFVKAWRDLKDKNLLEGYSYKIWTSKKNNIEYIKFKFIESLKP